MPRFRIPLALLSAIVVFGCQSSAIMGQKLTGDQIKAAVPGNTLHAKSVDGDFVAYFAADGTARINTGVNSDTGTYHITPDALCITWAHWQGGVEHCDAVFSNGGTYTLVRPNTVVFAPFTTSPGNTDQL
jgi:hypothetical protein